MNIQQNDVIHFWESLQAEMLNSSHRLSNNDILFSIEKSFMFSMFFRGFSQNELLGLQSLLQLHNSGFVILFELTEADGTTVNGIEIDEMSLFSTIKKSLPTQIKFVIGPLIFNRISILFTIENPENNIAEISYEYAKTLINAINKEYRYFATAGIGNVYMLSSIYTSFIEALRSLRYSKLKQAIQINDISEEKTETQIDYIDTLKHMLEAIRLLKVESYDYFSMLMDKLLPLNDEGRRNKILEILVLSNYMMQIDNHKEAEFYNYTGFYKELSELNGNELIEWAYKRFIYITGFVKSQKSIDYSNKVVLATKEFLEAHYAEDISLEDLAAQVNVSPQYFSKLIKRTTGFNFIDWLSILRVKKAKDLLANSNLTVKEVCFLVGYKDPNYFSRIFKKRIGITPSEFVKSTAINNNN